FVVPRTGTISPWSSKATDIAHACGFSRIERIERGIACAVDSAEPLSGEELEAAGSTLIDRMTEMLVFHAAEAQQLFVTERPRSFDSIPLMHRGRAALVEANRALALALSSDEIDYLHENYARLERDPTDAELMMFAQANSEHCRHKIFRADWIIDGVPQKAQLFDMIRST